MGGCLLEDDLEYTSSPLTLVLVGNKGSGKSATGNSIVGMEVFESKRSAFAVTNSSILRKTILTDGQVLNVIDTPGLFDSSGGIGSESIEKEIVSCMNMDTNGVDAFLLVFSVSSHLYEEVNRVIGRLVTLFGKRIYDYMIIVFTGGDELESQSKTLNDFLKDCPQEFKEILGTSGYRCVVFDNMTRYQTKKGEQVQQLLLLVNKVLEKNGIQPYTKEMYAEVKFETMLEQALRKERDACRITVKEARDERNRMKEDI